MKKLVALGLLATSPLAFSNVWDKVDTKADFRYRLENYKDEFKSESRSRQRIRARIGLKYQVDEMTKLKFRLATTGGATSTNDTLGDSDNASGAVYFDRAYVSHKAGDVKLNMGKMKNMFYKAGKNQLIWDGDLNFEGIHAGYSQWGAYLNLGSFWIKEVSASNKDVTLVASQLGYKGEAGALGYNVGVSNYHYQNAHDAGYTARDGKGTDLTGEGMNILETYLELTYAAAIPVKLFFTATTNNEAEEDNAANLIGLEVGKTKKKGSWKVGANMRTIENNALEGRYMDSDFAGQTTDSTGTIIYGKYMTTDNAYLSVGLFQNTVNADEKRDSSKDSEAYSKLHVDYGIKF